VVDTAQESPDDIRGPDRGVALTSARYTVGPRSVAVLVRPRSVWGGRTGQASARGPPLTS